MKKGLAMVTGLAAALMISVQAASFAAEKNEKKEAAEKQAETKKQKNNFYGYVEKMPEKKEGTWTIKGRQVTVDKDTEIEGKVKQGSYVKVKGKMKGNVYTAYEIELRKDKKKKENEEKEGEK